MTYEQIINLSGSAQDISDRIHSRIFAEAMRQVQYNLRSAHESFGLRYTPANVVSIASEVTTEVRRELDEIISPTDSYISMLVWRLSILGSHNFAHSL